MSQSPVPYDEIDVNVRSLVEVVNRFPGLHTVDSCGGHASPASYQEPEGQWRIGLEVDHTEEGWRSLEFLAWAVTDFRKAGHKVRLGAFSHPPYLNMPGRCLIFELHAEELLPDDFATSLDVWREEDYVAVEDDEEFQRYARGGIDDDEEDEEN